MANCGKSVSDYRMRYYLQDARQEEVMAAHLKDMVTYFVEEYAINWKKRPESIVWFRDGVSESQFKMGREFSFDPDSFGLDDFICFRLSITKR